MSPPEADFSLLRRFAEEGDHAAFAEIVRRYAGVVFAACHRVLRDSARAEDASQETFYRLMRKPQAVSQSLGAWLHAAATNLAVDTIRSESARHHREHVYADDVAQEHAAALPDEKAPTWAEVSPQVDAALGELPDYMRELLVEHFLRGRAQNELAAEADISTATMSRRIRSAIDALQRKLRTRGVGLPAIALAGFLHDHAMQAAPARLVSELGKITMMSGARAAGASSSGSLFWTAAAILGASMILGGIGTLWMAKHLPTSGDGTSQAMTTHDVADSEAPAPRSTSRFP